MKQKNPYFYTNLLAWGLVLFLIGNYVFGWTTPSANPPSSNLPAPINEGPDPQTKEGNLIIEGVLRLGQFTTANAPSGTEGALYYDTTENATKLYSNSAWGDLGGGWDGILPNYTTAQRTAIASPEYGMMIYNTDSARVEYYLPDAWASIQAPFATAHSCTAAIDCASEICVDGYCCNTLCTGNCNRCNVVGSLGTCTDVASDCTGNCDVCSAGNCAAVQATCTGNCDTCSGSGTAYSCAASDSLCTGNCDTCSGSGTAYSCAASASLCTGDCDTCSGSGTAYNCAASNALCSTCYYCTGSGTIFNCAAVAAGTSGMVVLLCTIAATATAFALRQKQIPAYKLAHVRMAKAPAPLYARPVVTRDAPTGLGPTAPLCGHAIKSVKLVSAGAGPIEENKVGYSIFQIFLAQPSTLGRN